MTGYDPADEYGRPAALQVCWSLRDESPESIRDVLEMLALLPGQPPGLRNSVFELRNPEREASCKPRATPKLRATKLN